MRRSPAGSGLRVVVVEDNEADARLLCEALRRLGLGNEVATADDVAPALRILREAAGRRAQLVFLDLRLRGSHGFDVLRSIRCEPSLSRVPVVVVTSSARDDDVERSYALDANYFLPKPIDLNGYCNALAPLAALCTDGSKMR